jgi:hypothetical protein
VPKQSTGPNTDSIRAYWAFAYTASPVRWPPRTKPQPTVGPSHASAAQWPLIRLRDPQEVAHPPANSSHTMCYLATGSSLTVHTIPQLRTGPSQATPRPPIGPSQTIPKPLSRSVERICMKFYIGK